MTKPQALIVDFGGVLTSPLQDAMVAFSAELEIELQDLVRAALGAYSGESDSLVTDFETGLITETEFAAAFALRLEKLTGKPVPAEGLVDRLFGALSLEEMMLDALVVARRCGLKTALLSNSWGLDVYPRSRFPELFDAVAISGEVGLRKPDPEIFHLIIEELGVPAALCVFVDDHPGHLKTARELGMRTVLHRTPAETIAELEELLGLELSVSGNS